MYNSPRCRKWGSHCNSRGPQRGWGTVARAHSIGDLQSSEYEYKDIPVYSSTSSLKNYWPVKTGITDHQHRTETLQIFHSRSRLARIAASLTKHCRRTSGQRSSCWGSAWLDGTLKARDGRRSRERRESALRDSLKRWAGGIWQEARCDPKDGMHGASLLHLRAWRPFPAGVAADRRRSESAVTAACIRRVSVHTRHVKAAEVTTFGGLLEFRAEWRAIR